MRAARFFIDAPLVSSSEIELPTPVAHHASRVLRLRDGAAIVLFNGTGGEFAATISSTGKHARAVIGEHVAIERESPLAVELVQAWIATEKLDWVVEKTVELGAHSIMLAPAARSVVNLTGSRLAKRIERLRDIAIAACAQCGRNRIPGITAMENLSAALQASLKNNACGVLLDVNAQRELTSFADSQSIALAVGPEGGFDEKEIALATQLGFQRGRLGPRVLRTETAGPAALAALQAIAGDFGRAGDRPR